MSAPARRSAGSLIISALFVLIGVVVLHDTTGYSDVDSKIFPRAVGIALILSAGVSGILGMVRPSPVEGLGTGSWWRRILLIAAMLVATLLMARIGFLAAGMLVFAGGLIAGMEDRWHLRTGLVYGLCSLVIVFGFHALFKYALYVPLP